jgi:hypothetical protein
MPFPVKQGSLKTIYLEVVSALGHKLGVDFPRFDLRPLPLEFLPAQRLIRVIPISLTRINLLPIGLSGPVSIELLLTKALISVSGVFASIHFPGRVRISVPKIRSSRRVPIPEIRFRSVSEIWIVVALAET